MQSNDLKSEKVIIRIWTSKVNLRVKGENVGHISLELPKKYSNHYISLWPEIKNIPEEIQDSPEQDYDYKELAKPILPAKFHELTDDLLAENRFPEKTIFLYTLNAEAINQEFERLKKNLQGWSLYGDNLLVNRGSAHSCASLAYQLVIAGGLYSLVTSAHSSMHSSIVTPDLLLETLLAARKAEEKQLGDNYPKEDNMLPLTHTLWYKKPLTLLAAAATVTAGIAISYPDEIKNICLTQ